MQAVMKGRVQKVMNINMLERSSTQSKMSNVNADHGTQRDQFTPLHLGDIVYFDINFESLGFRNKVNNIYERAPTLPSILVPFVLEPIPPLAPSYHRPHHRGRAAAAATTITRAGKLCIYHIPRHPLSHYQHTIFLPHQDKDDGTGYLRASTALHRAGVLAVPTTTQAELGSLPQKQALKFHECLFRVCPQLANKHQLELERLNKQRREVRGGPRANG